MLLRRVTALIGQARAALVEMEFHRPAVVLVAGRLRCPAQMGLKGAIHLLAPELVALVAVVSGPQAQPQQARTGPARLVGWGLAALLVALVVQAAVMAHLAQMARAAVVAD